MKGAASSAEAMSSSMMTEIHGVKIEKNPPQSKLDELGIANWIKWEREPQVIPWTFKPGEIMYFFKGKWKVNVEPHEDWFEVGTGDLVEFPTGMKVVVEIVEPVIKVYRFLTDNNEEAAST